MTLRLDLAVNPVPLKRPIVVMPRRPTGRIRAFTPDPAAFVDEFRWAVKAAGVHAPLAGPLRFSAQLWRRCKPRTTRGDLDNHVKAIWDAGIGFVWEDDSQFVAIGDVAFVEWGPEVVGRIVLEITQLAKAAG